MSRLLIVGINYAPEPTAVGPYTTRLAEYAHEIGHDVTVVTGLPSYPTWRVSRGYRRMFMDERINGVRVLRGAHYVPRRQSALRRAAYEATFALTGMIAASRTGRPDAVLAVIPALADGVVARAIARTRGVPYGLLFQDLVGPAAAQSGIEGGGAVARGTAAVERSLAANAAAVGVVSRHFLPYLHGAGVAPECVVEVPNWSRGPRVVATIDDTRAAFGWTGDHVIALHAGNIGLKQGLGQVVEAAWLAAETRPGYRFVFVGDGNQRALIEQQAGGLPNVEFLGLQPDATYAALLRAADVLLLSERPTQIDMSLPSKLTSYFSAGRPVVAAVHPEGATAGEIARSKAGVIVPAGRPTELLSALDALVRDPVRCAMLGRAGVAHAAEHLSEAASLAALDRLVERLLGSPGRHAGNVDPIGPGVALDVDARERRRSAA